MSPRWPRSRGRRRADQQRGLLAVGRAGDAADGGGAPAVRDERVRPAAADAAVLPGMRARARARSSTSARWAGGYASRAAAPTTRPSTRSRRSATRCGWRSRRFGIDVICVEPGLIRTEFGATAAGGVGPRSRPVRRVQRVGREVHARRLRGPALPSGRGRRRRRGRSRGARQVRAPSRVPVTASARVFMGMRRVLPDRAWDRVVGTSSRYNELLRAPPPPPPPPSPPPPPRSPLLPLSPSEATAASSRSASKRRCSAGTPRGSRLRGEPEDALELPRVVVPVPDRDLAVIEDLRDSVRMRSATVNISVGARSAASP